MDAQKTENLQQISNSYFTGFILSIFLTAAAFFVVAAHLFPSSQGIAVIVVLAIAQFFVQAIFFLRIGQWGKQSWNVIVFIFAFFVVVIVVVGSLWIMYHLNYNMSPAQMDNYMISQGDL